MTSFYGSRCRKLGDRVISFVHIIIIKVTIHLMDIAMECFHTTSGTHQQRYVLVAAQPARPSTRFVFVVVVVVVVVIVVYVFHSSRAAVQATTASSNISKKKTSKKGTRDWAGDILLKFRHSPKIAESNVVQYSYCDYIIMLLQYSIAIM